MHLPPLGRFVSISQSRSDCVCDFVTHHLCCDIMRPNCWTMQLESYPQLSTGIHRFPTNYYSASTRSITGAFSSHNRRHLRRGHADLLVSTKSADTLARPPFVLARSKATRFSNSHRS